MITDPDPDVALSLRPKLISPELDHVVAADAIGKGPLREPQRLHVSQKLYKLK